MKKAFAILTNSLTQPIKIIKNIKNLYFSVWEVWRFSRTARTPYINKG